MFTSTIGFRPSASALPATKRVCGMGPSAASTSRRKPSTMRRIRSTSPPKSACPGVSTMLILVSPHFTPVFFDRMVMPRSRSSGFESMTRSLTCWLARNTPAWRSIWSTSVVFPWSTCAMMAMLRICKGLGPDDTYVRGAVCEGRSIGGGSRKDKLRNHQAGGQFMRRLDLAPSARSRGGCPCPQDRPARLRAHAGCRLGFGPRGDRSSRSRRW